MKTIGLLGGMSWESTVTYYRLLNEGVRDRLGGLHSARIVMVSVDFKPHADQLFAHDWPALAGELSGEARRLEQAGAEIILICTNTMHKMYEQVQAAVSVPILHIADPTAAAIRAKGRGKIALLGTRFTMAESFYADRLATSGIDTVVPDEAGKEIVHQIIFDELVRGVIRDESRAAMLEVLQPLWEQGAQGVIAGCTEIGLLLKPEHLDRPLFETTELHARAAVETALAG